MNSTTLRGVFPEAKPVHKRNFIKENMRYIKQMQGIAQSSEMLNLKPQRTKSIKAEDSNKSQNTLKQTLSQSHAQPNSKLKKKPVEQLKLKDKTKRELLEIKPHLSLSLESNGKYSHRAVQTDKPEDIQKLYKHGIIKYPSPSVIKNMTKRNSPIKAAYGVTEFDRGDASRSPTNNQEDNLSNNMQSLDMNEKHNFIKENILALRQKSQRCSDINENTNKTQPYQKGVLPKYLRDRKEEQKKEFDEDPDCPSGHVLLPDEERKETLRVLRQSYADRIQELNSMPVRNDTLKMRRRKMAIEEELKKIDEGIKVFQRPKVFVKINA